MYLDALFVKVLRQSSGIRKEAVYVALGITPEGQREVLEFYLFLAKSVAVWQEEVLKDLWERGLRQVLAFVNDDLPGIEEAIDRVYPGADWQQCVVHKVRSTLPKVRKEDQEVVVRDLKRVYRTESREEAHAAWRAFVRRWGGCYPKVVRSWKEDSESLLCFLALSQDITRLPQEYEPFGAIHAGAEEGDQVAGSPVSQTQSSVQARIP